MNDSEIKELEKALEQIWDIALKFGLDPFPTKFEIVPASVMYEIGSYALPGRYSHWTFGKAYHKMKMMYDFGLSKIYEVVINTNPSYGFLMETNSPLQNKLVIAHVLGHTDFFKNNIYFSRTNRRMVDTVTTHTARMTEYEFKYGRKNVERFLDAVLSIEEHVDPNFFIKREGKRRNANQQRREGRYDDLLTNDEKGLRFDKDETSGIVDDVSSSVSREANDELPEKDLLYYIARHSPVLKDWQRDVIAMIREEMMYFIPQMQTKTINEGWACATGDSLLPTDIGFLRFDEIYNNRGRIGVAANSREKSFNVTDFHKEESATTLRLNTRRGLKIEGAHKHRVMRADGSWAYLHEIKIGDKLHIARGANVWAQEKQLLNANTAQADASLMKVALVAGVSLATVLRHFKGRRTMRALHINGAVQSLSYTAKPRGRVLTTRQTLEVAPTLDEDFAELLGCFVGDGNRTKSGICVTTGDATYARRIAETIKRTTGLTARVFWDATEVGGRWRIVVHSRALLDLLVSMGINLSDIARRKKIPRAILRSPKSVMSAFLRGYFDADAYAGKSGIILSSASENLIRTVQIVLLNYGILSTQSKPQDGCRQLHIKGASAKIFHDEIGFSLPRKQIALSEYVTNRRWFRKEETFDTVTAIETDCSDVYDITVDEAHAYTANGFLNHNSFWHSRIMRELDLPDKEHLEFAELHSGVVSPHKGSLNPYYIGYKILEDIERRWDNPSREEIEKQGRQANQGRAKIFEVREMEADVSFLRNYLTEDLCEELDLFVFELVDEEEWTVSEKRWERVRDQLVANMTNFGVPYIIVADGDYNRNRELYLKHEYEGSEIDFKYAEKVLEYVYQLWGRTVHLETMVDDEPTVLSFDGDSYDERTG